MTFAEGHLCHRTSDGSVSLLKLTPDDVIEQSRFKIPDHQPAMGATNPSVTGGRLWLRDDDGLLCYDVREEALDVPTLPALITLNPAAPKDVPVLRHAVTLL